MKCREVFRICGRLDGEMISSGKDELIIKIKREGYIKKKNADNGNEIYSSPVII